MIIYKRDIERRLLSLRLLFLILGTACFFAFKYHYDNLGYFILVVLIFMSIIVVRDFKVYSESFQISKYYLFGLIKRQWQFNKGSKIEITSFDSEFGAEGDPVDLDSTGTGLGCLVSIFSGFMPSRVTKRRFNIEMFSEANKLLKRVHIVLEKPEYNYLKTFI